MNLSTQSVDHPLSPKGRFGRLSYAAWTFLSSIIAVILIFVLAFGAVLVTGGNLEQGQDYPIFAIVLFIILYIVFIYFSFVFTIRRLHDRNQTGWLSLLAIVPFVNFIFIIYLLCAKGTAGENKFGGERETSGWEKVLGWIYIVIIPLAVIFALVGSAVPAYQEYVQRNQQAQIEQQINQAK
ncbi:hypothetical protein F909_00652 [Acinetobacter sp. ANC 3929]|uniref:DUF805 domain-containing protein n=1 Tax=unclassified Acinetobacter TaxID=196816 RepID=UPI0002CE75FF|nr:MULTISPECIES: DUF805 domain-containing protein [unclassified Acinetobacter]ENW83635.1 hypothetical protein F909_00652 [Acinetobacter sp. ANC 3929]MCH7350687.1 DUF805 domain-containing protein [Acinetobacter sp. NIPH 2023]MCH7354711.1 DUF805 domain-containing protein [Acinetobacter sp. NIPH 1958]MCH7358519.1 DUF805 domain-containing protein [Acinetobacter sp. NIPH 2024]